MNSLRVPGWQRLHFPMCLYNHLTPRSELLSKVSLLLMGPGISELSLVGQPPVSLLEGLLKHGCPYTCAHGLWLLPRSNGRAEQLQARLEDP